MVTKAITLAYNGGTTADSTGQLDINNTLDIGFMRVNSAPSGTSNTITTNEDTAHTFTGGDFGFSDSDANALAAVKITTLPGAGSLTDNGVAVSAGQSIRSPTLPPESSNSSRPRTETAPTMPASPSRCRTMAVR